VGNFDFETSNKFVKTSTATKKLAAAALDRGTTGHSLMLVNAVLMENQHKQLSLLLAWASLNISSFQTAHKNTPVFACRVLLL